MPGMKRTPTPMLHAADVPCPQCRVSPRVPCVTATGGTMTTLHQARIDWARELWQRANPLPDTGGARWLRHRIREGRAPAKPLLCGSEAAYRRHVAVGEEIDEACHQAALAAWTVRRNRAKAKA